MSRLGKLDFFYACLLETPDFLKKSKIYILTKVDSGHNSQDGSCAKGWPSFQCRCGMSPVSCVPKDDFHVVLRCDGTGAILPTPCGYTKKIGTTFGDELSETISISSTIGKTGLKEYTVLASIQPHS